MLGFKKEYGFGKNSATGLCYLAAIDFIQAQFTGQYISGHLGATKSAFSSGWVDDASMLFVGLCARYNFSLRNKRQAEIDRIPIRHLDDIKE